MISDMMLCSMNLRDHSKLRTFLIRMARLRPRQPRFLSWCQRRFQFRIQKQLLKMLIKSLIPYLKEKLCKNRISLKLLTYSIQLFLKDQKTKMPRFQPTLKINLTWSKKPLSSMRKSSRILSSKTNGLLLEFH
jgi:hypothetical protein